MPLEAVTIQANGQTISLFRRIAVHASVKHAARAMRLTLDDTVGAPTAAGIFAGGPQIQVMATGDLLFTGYVDRMAPKLDRREYCVEITARSKGQDAIDSSVDHTKPDYVNQDVLKVAKDQDKYGINFSCDCQLDGFDRWRPNVGDTLFDALRPLAEDEGATLSGQPDGSVRITRAGETAKAHAGYIAEGYAGVAGLWKGEASFDLSAQHSRVQSHGQTYKGSGSQALQIMGSADNDQVQRFRPFIEHHDRQTSKDRLKKRASRRRDKEQGEGTRATISVRGWRDMGGTLWTPGDTIFVVSPSLYLAQALLIETAIYDQGGSEGEGTITTLHLVDPRAHGGSSSGGGVNKSGSAWDFDASAAS